ncbi:MAG: HAMP domain-containing sensor histidine kinase [Verrucomicrobiota bacterium]
MPASFPLRWKILSWFFVNLALIALGVFLLFRAQFRVGIDSLLNGPTGDRLEALARPLAAELRTLPPAEWPAAFDRATAGWRARGLEAALMRNDGLLIAGEVPPLPPEIRQVLENFDRRKRASFGFGPNPGLWDRGGPRGRDGPGGRNRGPEPGPPRGPGPEGRADDHRGPGTPPPPDMDFKKMRMPASPPPGAPDAAGPSAPVAGRDAEAPLQKFMLVAGNPRTYWAGVHLDGAAITAREPAPLPVTLLLASDSLRGGGLFFDYLPWLILGGAMLTGSVLLWLPFVHRLTKALGGLTKNAEAIARGRFESPPVSGRRDELGRLERAHRDMATRLDGFVTGQKRFLGDTAHELLSPLARLEVGLSILEQRAAGDDAQYAVRALGEVRQMSSLVQDLLSFTKAGLRHPGAKPQSVVLADLAHEAVERETVDSDADVTIRIPGGMEVLALPSLLSRAIGNVVRNAVRYAAADGPVLLTAERRGEKVVLTVTDHGPGVPEDALPRLFDPFFRPDTSRTQTTGGTGLGLAIVKTAVGACNGTVTVRNGIPRGLILEMTLPAGGGTDGGDGGAVE